MPDNVHASIGSIGKGQTCLERAFHLFVYRTFDPFFEQLLDYKSRIAAVNNRGRPYDRHAFNDQGSIRMKLFTRAAERIAIIALSTAGLSLGALPVIAQPSLSQPYPSKPVRVVFPYPGGSFVDVVGRLVTQGMQEIHGQPFVWENRGGANGVIGTELVARSVPDGYTISFNTTSGFLYNPFFYKSVTYDVLKDFTPITAAVDSPITTVVHSSVPVNSVTQLVEFARRNPGKLNFGSFGTSSIAHIYGELIKQQTGVDMVHVPFKGAAAVITDLSVGRVEVSFLTAGSVLQHWKAGKVKILAINTPRRYKTLPDLPAITEEMPKINLLTNWMGFVAPAGLPAPVLATLNTSMVRVMNSPDFRKKMEDVYTDVIANRPDEFADLLKREYALVAQVVKGAGIKPE